MPEIVFNYPLKDLNTFGMKVSARAYSKIQDIQALETFSRSPEFKKGVFVLGGGSNILFTGDLDQWIWHNRITGVKKIKEDQDYVWIEAGGGMIWHEFVLYTIQNGYSGAENLSLIPGYVGAAPIQNIGAYGVEAKSIIESVRAWHIHDQCMITFKGKDCDFGYRESIFKGKFRGQFFITSVIFRLYKNPVFHTEYGSISHELEKMGIQELSTEAISKAVIQIRRSKLPDPAVVGNAGSFFKNPVIPNAQFNKLKKDFPEIPGYPNLKEATKVPAGWLIEKCGWKGFRKDQYGVHPKQALVLVNYGGASGKDIYQLSEDIIHSVQEKFKIKLEREVWVF